jgi:hypothetical protein
MLQRRTRTQDAVFGLSGWLFAELAIVLMLIALGSVAFAAPPKDCPPPPANPEGVKLETVKFNVHVDSDDAGTTHRFMEMLEKNVNRGQTPGFIMLFGVSLTNNPVEGVAVARRLKTLIKAQANVQAQQVNVQDQPQLAKVNDAKADDDSLIRPYLGGRNDGPPGDVKVELFLLTSPG